MKELAGQTIAGRYLIKTFLGQGELWDVYEAEDTRRSLAVVLKFLRPELADSPDFLRRFRLRLAALQGLEHPHLVPCYGLEQTRDRAFLVTGHISGISLEKCIQQHASPLSLRQALLILQGVGAALHCAHQRNLIHAEVKASNILLGRNGQAFLSDLGLAHWAQLASNAPLERVADYMAPEQCRAEPVDARTDVYALGIVLYEALTGRRPFEGKTAPEEGSFEERIQWEQLYLPPPSPRVWLPTFPARVEAAILRALSKDPAARPQSVAAFYEEVSGDTLAETCPAASELAALCSSGPPHGTPLSGHTQANLKLAAARLVAFLQETPDGDEMDEELTEGEQEEPPPSAAVPEPEEMVVAAPVTDLPLLPVELEKPLKDAPGLAAPEPPSSVRRVDSLLQKAGIEFLRGRWSRVQMICAVILELAPEHVAARVLSSEAETAQRTEQLYESAKAALEQGDTNEAAELLRQILYTDRANAEVRTLLHRLKLRK